MNEFRPFLLSTKVISAISLFQVVPDARQDEDDKWKNEGAGEIGNQDE